MAKFENIKAVGLDLDDTIFMTEQVCYKMENEVAMSLGHEPMEREVHLATWGQPLFEVITTRVPGIDVGAFEHALAPALASYINSGELDKLDPKTENAMHKLAVRGIQLFVVTSRTKMEAAHLIGDSSHKLSMHINEEWFYHSDKHPYQKPDPRVFDWLFEKGFEPASCVYVGDSVTDGLAATQAGMHFVASMESGIRKPEEFVDIPGATFIQSLAELPEIVS